MSQRVVWSENIRVGVDALRIHPSRTLLSVLGITIGCAALVSTMAVSDGMMRFARDKIEQQTSAQMISIRPRTSAFKDGRWVPVHDYPVFGSADLEGVRACSPQARNVTLVLGGRASAQYRGVQHNVSVTLGSASLPGFGGIELGAGRFFNEVEVAARAPVVVINYALAREFAQGRDPYAMLDRDMHVNHRRQRVVGVLAPSDFEDASSPTFSLVAPIGGARTLLDPPPGGRFAPTIQMLAPSVEEVEGIRDAMLDWVSRRYPRIRDRVRVDIGLESLREVELGILVMKLFIGALVGISLLVGGVGIMNVLLASVAERTREIGIRKSVGARRADIRTQFLTESVSIAMAGAVVGLVFGVLLAFAATTTIRMFAKVDVSPVVSWGTVLLATLSSSAVGLLFGTIPARRAAELPPIAAIAHE